MDALERPRDGWDTLIAKEKLGGLRHRTVVSRTTYERLKLALVAKRSRQERGESFGPSRTAMIDEMVRRFERHKQRMKGRSARPGLTRWFLYFIDADVAHRLRCGFAREQ